MNQKELSEIRRRFKQDRTNINKVYGCYVNSNKHIISHIDTSMAVMTSDEKEMVISLLKKAISGSLGRNLLDISFSTAQVAGSEEHRLLQTLRRSSLEDENAREELFNKIIASLEAEDSSYLILLASEKYDVPFYGKDGINDENRSENVFSYFICSICPVKPSVMALRYCSDNGEFHGIPSGQVVSNPQLGFMFPCFDDRAANIYNALYYTRDASQVHQELIDAVFRTPEIMSAPQQKNAFGAALSDSLDKECSFEAVQAVTGRIRDKIVEHKESRDPAPLEMTVREVETMLISDGIPEEKARAFGVECEKNFGENAVLNPKNIIETGKLEIITPQAKINVAPDFAYMIESRVINGRKYILIPADDGVEVNGVSVDILKK